MGWLVFSDWSDIEEAVVTAGRLDTEDAEFGLEVVLLNVCTISALLFVCHPDGLFDELFQTGRSNGRSCRCAG